MYNKLFGKIVTSSVWLEPTPTRLLWVTMLALMDRDGFVEMASVRNLAHTARLSLEETEAAILVLESADKDSSDPENEGKRVERVPGGWLVLNASKYSELVTREVARERTRERVRKHRASRNGGVTARNADVTQSEAEAEVDTKTKKKKERVVFDVGSVAGLNSEAWEIWTNYRSAINKPLKPVSQSAAAKQLAKFGHQQMAVVEQSIANQWQGLFPIKASGAVVPKESNYDRFMRLNGGPDKRVIDHE